MKKNKTVKKPRTIADLKFDWEITYDAHRDLNLAQKCIEIQNPHLKGLTIVPGKYTFLINDHVDVKLEITKVSLGSVIEFFEYLCWDISRNYSSPITGQFSHFERIDDLTYRIHMK